MENIFPKLVVILGFIGFGAMNEGSAQMLTIQGNFSYEQLFDTIEVSVREWDFRKLGLGGLNHVMIRVDWKNKPWLAAISEMVWGTDISVDYDEREKAVCITRKHEDNPNIYLPLRGLVVDESGLPLVGASVTLEKRRGSSFTDKDGLFEIVDAGRLVQVTVSYTGYESKTQSVRNVNENKFVLIRDSGTLEPFSLSWDGGRQGNPSIGIATINVADLSYLPISNIMEGLADRVPGVAVRQLGGGPGANLDLSIGGIHSIAQGRLPLILVNGVPLPEIAGFANMGGTQSIIGSYGMNPLDFMDVDNIEKVEILKDVAAMAIYGSRGANGVILITLKKAGGPRSSIHFDGKWGQSYSLPSMPMLNTAEYLAMRREAIGNDGIAVNETTLPEAAAWGGKRNTDFRRVLTGNAALWREARLGSNFWVKPLQLSGLVNGHYHVESGVFKEATQSRRGGLYSNFVKRAGSMMFHLTELINWQRNLLLREDPSLYIMSAPNAPNPYEGAYSSSWTDHSLPYYNMRAAGNSHYLGESRNWFNQLQYSYGRDSGFSLKGNAGYYVMQSAEEIDLPIVAQDPESFPTGHKAINHFRYRSILAELTPKYSVDLGKHRLSLLLGATWQQASKHVHSWVGDGYASDAAMSKDFSPPELSVSVYDQRYRYLAGFGRFEYGYDRRFFGSVSFRRDGSSRFGLERPFGNFWSASGAWIFTGAGTEAIFPWLSKGKLRASYGVTGNDQVADLLYAQSYRSTLSARGYQGMQGMTPVSLQNTHIGWETNRGFEGALELEMLDRRLKASIVAYESWTGNQLVNGALASQSGWPSVITNQKDAVLRNWGWELSLESHWRFGRYWSWLSRGCVTWQRNVLEKFPGLANSSYSTLLQVGQSVNVFRGLKYEGVDRQTGLFSFLDKNGDGVFDRNDYEAHGHFDVNCFGSWENGVQWKQLTLKWLVGFWIQTVRNPLVSYYALNGPGMAAPSMLGNVPKVFLMHWRSTGDEAPLQRLTSVTSTEAAARINDVLVSDMQVCDGSFIRLRSVCLQYEMPSKSGDHGPVASMIFYVSAQNCLRWTRFRLADPESQDPTVVPPYRTINVGFRVTIK